MLLLHATRHCVILCYTVTHYVLHCITMCVMLYYTVCYTVLHCVILRYLVGVLGWEGAEAC